jgi:hypothetical protein
MGLSMPSISEKNGSIGTSDMVWSTIELAADAGCNKKASSTATSSSMYILWCEDVGA